jgi:hypothetical protein
MSDLASRLLSVHHLRSISAIHHTATAVRANPAADAGRLVRRFGVSPAIGGRFLSDRQGSPGVSVTLTRGNAP